MDNATTTYDEADDGLQEALGHFQRVYGITRPQILEGIRQFFATLPDDQLSARFIRQMVTINVLAYEVSQAGLKPTPEAVIDMIRVDGEHPEIEAFIKALMGSQIILQQHLLIHLIERYLKPDETA